MVEKIRAAGGEIYAVTSEPQRLADEAKKKWELDFETVGDPHHEISSTCVERGLLELIVNTKTELLVEAGSIFSHPKGYFQPGVLALDSNARVLYRWRGIPTRKNMGGATERPTADHVFNQVSLALASATSGTVTADAELDTNPELDSRGLPWPLFMSLLVSNGWFIKPDTFGHRPGGPTPLTRIKRALIRIPFFVAAWAIAFAYLPSLWVGLALVGWGAWLTPKIRYFNEQFQSIPNP
ncbi:MAG: hypothetical protein ACI8W3_000366 [Myxococcota bacterium]